MTPDDVIAALGLVPHPEGGWYAETWRDEPASGGRGHGTAIYFLLVAGQTSRWHTVDAVETFHYYAGAAVELLLSDGTTAPTACRLGPDLAAGERPQVVIPAGHWQAARSTGAWSLVGCTVSPAFDFDGFQLAPEGWEPGPRPE